MDLLVRGRAPNWQRAQGESRGDWVGRLRRGWVSIVGRLPPDVHAFDGFRKYFGYVSKKVEQAYHFETTFRSMADSLDDLDELYGEAPVPETYAELVEAAEGAVAERNRSYRAGLDFVEPVLPPVVEEGVIYWVSLGPAEEGLAAAVSAAVREAGGAATYRYVRRTMVRGVWGEAEARPFSQKKNERAKELMPGHSLTPGWIEYLIDSMRSMYNAPDAVLMALVPMAAPGPWLPMRAGEVNCVAHLVRKYYEGLKPSKEVRAKLEAIDAFEAAHRAGGVVPADLAPLGKRLRASFAFWGAGDEMLERVGEHDPKSKTFHFTRHNGHCWNRDALPKMPGLESRALVVVPDEKTALEELLGREKSWILEQVAPLMAPGEMAWKVGPEVLTAGGTIYRPAELAAKMEEAVRAEGITAEAAPAALLELGGPQAFRFRRWSDANGLRRVAGELSEAMADAQVETRGWNTEARYETTWGEERGPLGEETPCTSHYELDMRAAYLCCEDPAGGRTKSDCEPYLRAYRMPHADGRMTWSAVTDLSQVEKLPGSFVRFGSWRFAGHDYLRAFEAHLEEHRGMMPTPLAVALWRLGFLAEHTLVAVATSFEAAPLLRFLPGEEDKVLSIRFVGSCAHKARTSVVFSDPEEAKHYHRVMAEKGCRPMAWAGGGLQALEYDDPEGGAKYPHVRAYVLAYMHIAVLSKLAACPGAVRVATDSITLPGAPPPAPENPKYGEWRVKDRPKSWRPDWAAGLGGKTTRADLGQLGAEVAEYPALPPGLFEAPLIYLDGQGGSGKTTMAIEALAGRRVVVLSKDWLGVGDLEDKIGEAAEKGSDVKRMEATTYHTFWHVGFAPETCPAKCGKCFACAGWNPATMGRSAAFRGLPEVVVWDEPGYAPAEKLLRPVLAYCREKGVRVIAAGDVVGQQRQFRDRGAGDPEVHRLLSDLGAQVVFMEGDRRALCPELRALKKRIWRQPEPMQMGLARAALEAVGRAGRLKAALAAWHPRALFAVCTNQEGKQIEEALLKEHEARFPDHPVPMRFAPGEADRKLYRPGSTVLVPGYLIDGAEEVPAVVGTKVWVERGAALHYLRNEPGRAWVYDGWRTIHGLQGHTVGCETDEYDEEHSLFVLTGSLGGTWNRNATYTAVSRVRHLRQLYWVAARPGEKLQEYRRAGEIDAQKAMSLVYGD